MAKPIIPWMGGKRRLAKQILPKFPEHKSYIEPFAGGAAMLFMKEPSKAEVINDINGELTSLYRVVRHHLQEFIQQFRWSLVSREMFEWLKLEHPDTLTDIQRAARFYYLQKLAFGGKSVGQTFGVDPSRGARINLLRIEEELSQAHLRLSKVCIEHLDWHNCIQRYDRPFSFFYCDPPYWKVAGYGVDFGWEQYEMLAETFRNLQGKALLSINDHPDIRELFKDFHMEPLTTSYTVGGHPIDAKELLIYSWQP